MWISQQQLWTLFFVRRWPDQIDSCLFASTRLLETSYNIHPDLNRAVHPKLDEIPGPTLFECLYWLNLKINPQPDFGRTDRSGTNSQQCDLATRTRNRTSAPLASGSQWHLIHRFFIDLSYKKLKGLFILGAQIKCSRAGTCIIKLTIVEHEFEEATNPWPPPSVETLHLACNGRLLEK